MSLDAGWVRSGTKVANPSPSGNPGPHFTRSRREGYTALVKIVEWRPEESAHAQLDTWCKLAKDPGVLQVRFGPTGDGEGLSWEAIEPWTRTRAVTVAEVG